MTHRRIGDRLPGAVVWVAVALAAVGCSRSGASGGAASGSEAALAAVMDGAPHSLPELLAWAESKIQAQPAPVPLPADPVLPPPRWTLIRLDDPDRLASAQIETAWTPAQDGPQALAHVGPIRSDDPTTLLGRRIVKAANADGSDGIELLFGGFSVQCEQVGSMVVNMRVPFGRHVTLLWAKAGQITVPVPTHDRPFPVRIATDGLAEWEGRLDKLGLLTDGVGSEPILIESVVFMSRADAFPRAMAAARVRLGSEIRSAIYVHAPGEITFSNVVIPPNGKMHVGLGHICDAPGETTFEVAVEHDGQRHAAASWRISSADAWDDATFSLAQWSGRTVSLRLRSTSTAPRAVALWGNPVIYEPQPSPPAVVLYLIDTLGAEHVDLYGYSRATMPRLAELSRRGVLFTNAVSNSSRTIESIPDLMLSLPAERHGVHHNSTPAAAELVTLAEVLRAAGFATVSLCTNVNAGPRQGMDQGFDTFIDRIGYYWTDFDRTIPLEETRRWLDFHQDRPVFLYIHTAEPHAPYTPPEGFAGRFDPDYRGIVDGTYHPRTGFRQNIQDPQAQLRDLQHVVALYDEEILYADHRLGLLLDELDGRGMLNRTHFWLVSDHGEEFLEHGMWEHGLNLHNEQTRIPLLAVGPGLPAGQRVDVPVQLMDVMPTVLELFGLPAPYELRGRSLLPLLHDGAPDEAAAATFATRDLFLSNHNYRISHKLIEYAVIEAGRWKLMYSWRPWRTGPVAETSHFLLFDLSADPRERQNVIAQHPEVARRLIEKLLRYKVLNPPYASDVNAEAYEVTSEQMRQLQALGYVGGPASRPDEQEAP